MRNIDDRMIEKALWNLKWMRRLKPFFAILGLTMLAFAGFLARFLYLYLQEPRSVTGSETSFVAMETCLIVLLIYTGVFLLCTGLFRNNKDIILEHLAEQYLKDKQKTEESTVYQAPPGNSGKTPHEE